MALPRTPIFPPYLKSSIWIALLIPAIAGAQTAITDVVNAGNRIGSGLPGYGIAQGGLFAVIGPNVGPSQPVQATFPLPTTDGLGGVTIAINVSGSTTSAIMVYASSGEVDAILPSSTPLGTGTVTLNNNGATATAPLTVVPSAFGIFTTAVNGARAALAFNLNPDGSTSQNGPLQSAQPGQTVMINGTGLGAIASDETQSGATDVPSVSPILWVANVQVAVMSAGRGTCCAGLDPSYPFPPGIAAWDVISFVVPDGVSGCQVSIAVQIGNSVSNLAPIAVAPGGGTCPEVAAALPGGDQALPEPFVNAQITASRNVTNTNLGTSAGTITADSATAAFTPVDLGMPVPASSLVYSALSASPHSCSVAVSRSFGLLAKNGPQGAPLDAGPVINIVDPDLTQTMPKEGTYYAASASITVINIPGIPPIRSGGAAFFEPGAWTMNNGAGGADIGAFSIPLVNPQPVTVTGFDQLTSVPRGHDMPLAWTGGDPGGMMQLGGAVNVIGEDGVTYRGSWYCTVPVADGKFIVPGFVTARLPAGGGMIAFTPIIFNLVQIPGVDFGSYNSTWSIGKETAYP